MQLKKNKFNFSSEQIKTYYLNEIISYFQTERGEVIGVIAAEEILNFFFETMGDEIYKKAVLDCKKLLKEKMLDLEVELDTISER